jgi:hypothetical protein
VGAAETVDLRPVRARRMEMRYQVRYLADGDEETARIEAANAPEAAETVEAEHEDDKGHFELLAVQPEADAQATNR